MCRLCLKTLCTIYPRCNKRENKLYWSNVSYYNLHLGVPYNLHLSSSQKSQVPWKVPRSFKSLVWASVFLLQLYTTDRKRRPNRQFRDLEQGFQNQENLKVKSSGNISGNFNKIKSRGRNKLRGVYKIHIQFALAPNFEFGLRNPPTPSLTFRQKYTRRLEELQNIPI